MIPPGTPLAPRNTETDHDVTPWDELSDQERELFARHMEVYAAMVDGIDQSVGHLLGALDELGERDNTIVIFLSDNGGSREGEVTGTSSYYVHLLQGDDVEADRARLDLLGGPQTTPHYPRGWAMASNTPWRLYKINTHAGGHTVPFILSWPGGGLGRPRPRPGGAASTPTSPTCCPRLCELVGIEPDRRRADPGPDPTVPAEPLPLAGSSFVATLTDPGAPSGHHSTVEEMNGHRGLYRDGWEVVTLHQPLTPFVDDEWELYDLGRDPVELEDRSAVEPARRAEMIETWEREAWANQIYPLDEGSAIRYLIRPERSEVFRQPVRIVAGTPTLERWRSVQLVWFRSVTITAELDYAAGRPGRAGGPRRPGERVRALRARRRAVVRAQRRPGSDATAVGWDRAGRRPPPRGRADRRGRGNLDGDAGGGRPGAGRARRASPCSTAWPRSRGSMWASTDAHRWTGTSTSVSARFPGPDTWRR